MTKKATVNKKLASVKTQVKQAKLNSNVKFGKFHPDAKLKATGMLLNVWRFVT